MKTFAMILLNRVIDIVISETAPNYPPDRNGNIVTTVECDGSVKIGMFYKDSVFSEYVEPEPTPEPLSPTEQTILQTAITTEYMAAMMETTI